MKNAGPGFLVSGCWPPTNTPDHNSLAVLRQRHLAAVAGVFLQVLLLCQFAGLVKLGGMALGAPAH